MSANQVSKYLQDQLDQFKILDLKKQDVGKAEPIKSRIVKKTAINWEEIERLNQVE